MAQNSSIFRSELPNGTVVLVDPDPRFSSVTAAVCFTGGLSDETEDVVGVSHLLEHLLFKQTSKKSSRELAAAMDELGGEVNAFTDFDSLCVHGTAPRRQFRELSELIGEVLFEHRFAEPELTVEKEIVRQEILEAEDSASDATYQCLSRTLWPGSIFRFPVFGTLDSVERLTLRDLEQRREKLFCGKRCIIACCGGVEPDEVLRFAERAFASLAPGTHCPVQAPVRGTGFAAQPHQANQVHVVLSQPWIPADSTELAAGLVISTILGGGLSSRLFQKLREQEGLAYEISSSVEMVVSQANLMISSVVERSHVDQALKIMVSELQSAAGGDISDAEMVRAKKLLRARFDLDMDSPGNRLWYALDHEIRSRSFADASHPDAIIAGLERLSLADVHGIAAGWLLKNPGVAVLGGDIEGYQQDDVLTPLLKGSAVSS